MNTASGSSGIGLQSLTLALRDLHKNLVQVVKTERENALMTQIDAGQLLQLLTKDPHFDWLHELSEYMARLDELLDAHDPSQKEKQEILSQASALIMPAEGNESAFYRRYVSYLQNHPDLTMAHANVRRILVALSPDSKGSNS